MYNDELDMALESAYEDGYYQALADMGYEFDDADDEATEDVELDIFDEDYFDESMEGAARDYRRAQNAGKSANEIRSERRKNDAVWGRWDDGEEYNKTRMYGKRHNLDHKAQVWNREQHLMHNHGADSMRSADPDDMRTKYARNKAKEILRDPKKIEDITERGLAASKKSQAAYNKMSGTYKRLKDDNLGGTSRLLHKGSAK